MKKLLIIAIALTTSTVFASRARNAALGNSLHIMDFYSPEQTVNSSDLFRIETGVTDATGTKDGAEGTLIKSMGDAKLSLSLGHKDSLVSQFRQSFILGMPLVDQHLGYQQNPIEFGYALKTGDMSVGGGIIYSNYNDKANDVKESTMGVKLGAATDLWYVGARLFFVDKFEDGTTDYKGKTPIAVRAGYYLNGDLSVHGNLSFGGYKIDGTNNYSETTASVEFVDSKKSEGNEFFYGAGLTMKNGKDSDTDKKVSTLKLPFVIGLETQMNSWLTFRGSVTQDVILSNEKDEVVAGTEVAPGENTTTFAAGVGIQAGKVLIDGTIMNGASQQEINSNDLLAQVGLTYNF